MAKKSSTPRMPHAVDALPFLMRPEDYPPRLVCVVAGDDGYLRHEVRMALCDQLFPSGREQREDEGQAAAELFDLTTYAGHEAELSDVLDALRERSLFGTRERVVVVEDADSFVQRYRAQLEKYVERPTRDALLVLDLQSWLKTTRLAKAVAKSGLTINCHVPQQGREATTLVKQLKDWLIHTAQCEHGVQLQRPAVDLLLDRMPREVGIIYQEVAKLALLVDPEAKAIDRQLVAEQVGGWRARKTWDMIDAAAEGRADDALMQLDRLIASGEEPHALLPQMASTLRRFTLAVRLYENASRQGQRCSLKQALEQAGIPKFKLHSAEAQLRQIGRVRARRLLGWLLAADLELKGYNSAPQRARCVIETLIVRLSRQAQPPQQAPPAGPMRTTSAGTR
jgi:DNA polymerase-3 subunit delta